jgi:hypothetical protein
MKVILDIALAIKGKSIALLRKEYYTELHPTPGIRVHDPAWKELKVPTSVNCDFEMGCYLLSFEDVEVDTEENCKKEEEMFRSHGWKRPSEWALRH